jgi:hypothetical protein
MRLVSDDNDVAPLCQDALIRETSKHTVVDNGIETVALSDN